VRVTVSSTTKMTMITLGVVGCLSLFLSSSCGGGQRVEVMAPNQTAIPLDGEAAGFVGPTESCALGGPRRVAGALITNLPQTCSALRAKSGGNSSGLFLYIAAEGTDLPPLGTYHVGQSAKKCEPANDIIAELVVADGSIEKGTSSSRHLASAGTITLTKVTTTQVGGSFDVTFDGGGHARGSFAAPVCNIDWTLFGRPRPREELR
jgi:hypothetical protein